MSGEQVGQEAAVFAAVQVEGVLAAKIMGNLSSKLRELTFLWFLCCAGRMYAQSATEGDLGSQSADTQSEI